MATSPQVLAGRCMSEQSRLVQRAVPRFFASDIGQLVCVYLGQLPPVDPATGGLAPKVSTSRLYACTHRVTQEFEVYAQKLRCAAQINRHNRRSPRIVCA